MTIPDDIAMVARESLERIKYRCLDPVKGLDDDAVLGLLESILSDERERCVEVCRLYAAEYWGYTEDEFAAAAIANRIIGKDGPMVWPEHP